MADAASAISTFAVAHLILERSGRCVTSGREFPISDGSVTVLVVILLGVWLLLLYLDAPIVSVVLFLVRMGAFAGLVEKLRIVLITVCGVAVVVAMANLFGGFSFILWGTLGIFFVWFLPQNVLLLTLGILSHSRSHYLHHISLEVKLGLSFLAVSAENA